MICSAVLKVPAMSAEPLLWKWVMEHTVRGAEVPFSVFYFSLSLADKEQLFLPEVFLPTTYRLFVVFFLIFKLKQHKFLSHFLGALHFYVIK